MKFLSEVLKLVQKRVYGPVRYWRKQGVKIGESCSLGSTNFGGEPFLVSIGNHVQITDNVHFLTHGGGWVIRKEIPDLDFFGKIEIKDNVYIGSGAYILPGVIVESNVIIAARAVVTKSVPSGVIVAGNPARIVGTVDDFKNKMSQYNLRTKGLSLSEKRKIIMNADNKMFIRKDYLH